MTSQVTTNYPLQRKIEKITTFVSKFGSFAYKVMSLGLKNGFAVFSKILVKIFKSMYLHIYKFSYVFLSRSNFGTPKETINDACIQDFGIP